MKRQIPASSEDGRTGLPLIAEAMARGLKMALRGIANAESRSELERHLATHGWIRDAMDAAHGEAIFKDFVNLYSDALVRHSEPAINRAMEDVPAATMIGLYLSLERSGPGREPPRDRSERMLHLGQAFGMGARQLSMSALHYGVEQGLFPGQDFGLTPELRAVAGRLGPGPEQEFDLVDPTYFEMLRGFEGIRREIESDWGSLHPLVRGFGQQYEQDPWMRTQGVEQVRQAVSEVEDFVTRPRH